MFHVLVIHQAFIYFEERSQYSNRWIIVQFHTIIIPKL